MGQNGHHSPLTVDKAGDGLQELQVRSVKIGSRVGHNDGTGPRAPTLVVCLVSGNGAAPQGSS